MFTNDEFLKLMIELARRAGEISLKNIDNIKFSLKEDTSVLTETDVEISNFIKEGLSVYVSMDDHILIDEEDDAGKKYFDQKLIDNCKYIWSVDPIDGTRAFSNGVPLFGVSIGLLKDKLPFRGVVYFPMLNELFYGDEKNAWFVQNAFEDNQTIKAIKLIDQNITKQSMFIATDLFLKTHTWDSYCQIMMPTTAVCELCWPSIGRSCASFFKANIWDFAGSWPIYNAAGLKLRSVVDGHSIESLDLALFKGDQKNPWNLKDQYILSSERNYQIIREHIRPINI